MVEFLAQLPASQRMHRRATKWLLREVGRPMLPAEIVERRDKVPFPLPVEEWLMGKLAEPVQRILGSSASRRRGIFLPHVLSERGFRVGHGWTLLCLELWFRLFIDRTLEPGTPLREIDA